MASPEIQSLLDLDVGTALRRYQRTTNAERLRWVATALAIVAFAGALYHLFYADWLRLVAPLLLLGVVRWVYLDHDQLREIREPALVGTLLVLFGLAALLPANPRFGLELVSVFGPVVALAFRLRWTSAAFLLLCVLFGTQVPLWWGRLETPNDLLTPATLVAASFTVLFFFLILRSTKAAAQRFAHSFRIETSRNREQQRIRSELSSARQIQMSMLPAREPDLPDFDVSAASLPAAEVGGDYYEYFIGSDRRLTIVLADVAGHGLASGLLLSGVRSCLYLLHAEDEPPHTILHRLDRMLRATTQRRMFVTMLYSVFDLDDWRLVEASGGHPAALRYVASSGEVEVLENPALPLGTRLEPTYRDRESELAPGDVFLLYTDGLTEVLNEAGNEYGEQRLVERLRRTARGRSAREIREAILNDIWNFKGNAEQVDDITLIAVRIRDDEGVAGEDGA